ncbi:MAG TPA: (d)CMP kinase [Kofleriaceae bacterium]|nr:(d)CMP kinase [Kofleriaceae bacterium]
MTSASPGHAIVVAIDGPAGAGKSTVARRLAAALGYRLLDTGALYRAVALTAIDTAVDLADAGALADIAAALKVEFRLEADGNHVLLAGTDVTAAIRTPEVAEAASQVSALPPVRAALLALQRRLGAGGGVVAEGRDVGTVVFPDAGAKFFLTADEDVRARRRHDEMCASGNPGDLARTREEMRRRDARDAQRKVAPLACAPDAVVVDSSALTLAEVVDRMLALVRSRETATTG